MVALAAILLTLMALLFIATNPWMLAGVAAVLFAIAAIVRAINGGPADGSSTSDAEPPTPLDSHRFGCQRRQPGPRIGGPSTPGGRAVPSGGRARLGGVRPQ